MGAYNFEINEKIAFKPSKMFRYVENSPVSVDLTLALNFNAIFEFGTAYRLNEGFAGFLIFELPSNLNIGYAYKASLNSTLATNNNGTQNSF